MIITSFCFGFQMEKVSNNKFKTSSGLGSGKLSSILKTFSNGKVINLQMLNGPWLFGEESR